MAPGRGMLWLLAAAAMAALALAAGCMAQSNDPPRPLSGYRNAAEAAQAARDLAGWSAWRRRAFFKSRCRRSDERPCLAYQEDNFQKLIAWNRQGNNSFIRGFNLYSELSFPEFQSKYLMQGVDPRASRRRRAATASAAGDAGVQAAGPLPQEWDWRSPKAGGNVPPIRPSQGPCGSCWAQAAIAALESRAMRDNTDDGPNLSEQQLLDCVGPAAGFRSRGCAGGLAEEALEYISSGFVATQTAYAAAPGAGCKARGTSRAGAISLVSSPGFRPVASNADAIMRAVYFEGPVVVYFQVSEGFVYYDSGVFPASACQAVTGKGVNHAMVIIGYSRAEKYWLVRNSWGEGWGIGGAVNLGGTARIQMTFDSLGPCRMYEFPVVPQRTARYSPKQPPRPPPPRPPRPRPPLPPPPQKLGPPPPSGVALATGSVCTCNNRNVEISELRSANGRNRLVMRGDGNVASYRDATAMWSSFPKLGAAGAQYSLVLQVDGNLVGYQTLGGQRTSFWSTKTDGRGTGPYRLVVQNSGAVQLFDSTALILWSSVSGSTDQSLMAPWTDVACSADGTLVAAVVDGGAWWWSKDAGRSWLSDNNTRAFSAVAVSGNGAVNFAAEKGGSVFYTANGWADTFRSGTLATGQWTALATSSSGTKLLAAANGSNLFVATFNVSNPLVPSSSAAEQLQPGQKAWSAVAMDAAGNRLLAAAINGSIYESTDGGTSWVESAIAGTRNWVGVAIAGLFQFAIDAGGKLYGTRTTWGTSVFSIGDERQWTSVAAVATDATSARVVAGLSDGTTWSASLWVQDGSIVYSSAESATEAGAGRAVNALAFSGDGSQVLAAVDNGRLLRSTAFFPGLAWARLARGVRAHAYGSVASYTDLPNYSQLTQRADRLVPTLACVTMGSCIPEVADADHYVVLFTGSLIITKGGRYTFYLSSDDGSRLLLNDQVVIGHWGAHDFTEKTAIVDLQPGWYPIRVDFLEWIGAAGLLLQWSGPVGGKQSVPGDSLCPMQV